MASEQRDDVNITEKRIIVEVLELYKDFPCLWDTSYKLYCNKDARNQALEIILEKYKICYLLVTTDKVKKKIERLRAAYRRERKKVENSKSSGAGVEYVHTSSLWYYPYLTFLHEKTQPTSEGIDNLTENSDSNSEEPARKKEKDSTKRQNILYKSSSYEGTSADAFGHSVGPQMKKLPKLQRCIVKNLIGELIYYAKLGELSLDASINLNKKVHSHSDTYPQFTQPYSRYLHHQYSSQFSPLPQHSQTSPYQSSSSPSHSQPSSQYSQPSSSPQHSQTSPYQPSPSPQQSQTSSYQPSPSPQHQHLHQLPSPHHLQHLPSYQRPPHQQSSPSLQHPSPRQHQKIR